jgi:hypothetical protein
MKQDRSVLAYVQHLKKAMAIHLRGNKPSANGKIDILK